MASSCFEKPQEEEDHIEDEPYVYVEPPPFDASILTPAQLVTLNELQKKYPGSAKTSLARLRFFFYLLFLGYLISMVEVFQAKSYLPWLMWSIVNLDTFFHFSASAHVYKWNKSEAKGPLPPNSANNSK